MTNIRQFTFNRMLAGMVYLVVSLSLSLFLVACATTGTQAVDTTRYYLIRHAEIVKKDPNKPLNTKGKARAQVLVRYMQGTRLTHIYATHTDRTRDTAKALAKARNLRIEQFPAPGSSIKGEVVNNRTKGKFAIKPMIKALQAVPNGSAVLVSANSGNLYAIMAGLGVKIKETCKNNQDDCLPCRSKKCFPKKQFNNIWTVLKQADGQVTMSHGQYGD